MKHYPRALNRSLLAILGLILLAVGGFLVVLPFWPQMQEEWSRLGDQTWTGYQELANQYRLSETVSWLQLVWVLIAIIASILLFSWIIKQGGGKTNEVLSIAGKSATGTASVDAGLVQEVFERELGDNRLIATVEATAWNIKNDAGIKLKIIAADGASVDSIRSVTKQAIANLDSLLGEQIPVLVHITTGWTSSTLERVE